MKYFLLVAILVVVAGASSVKSSDDSCMGLVPTLFFAYQCPELNVHNTWCFYDHKGESRSPTPDDVLHFNASYQDIVVPFSFLYTPLIVKAVLLGGDNSLYMTGGGIQVTDCFLVKEGATLILSAFDHLDSGASPTTAYLPDGAATPHGTGCADVSQGFTPRICGPGKIRIDGNMIVNGLYASIFAATEISPTGSLIFGNSSSLPWDVVPEHTTCSYATSVCAPFLWGALTNDGALTATSDLFLHGSITNNNYSSFTSIRTDVWSPTPRVASPVIIVNNGIMTFDSTSRGPNADILSPAIGGDRIQYILKLVNNKGATVSFADTDGSAWWVGGNSLTNSPGNGGLDIFNYGSIAWSGRSYFLSYGSFINAGVISADGMSVWLNDYLSQGGTTKTTNGGYFNLGNGAGADTKTSVMCKKDESKKKAQDEDLPEQKNIGSFFRATKEVRMASRAHKKAHSVTNFRDSTPSNTSCNFALYPQSGCADSTMCCGSTGLCEPGNCCWYGGPNSLSGSFGTPGCDVMCCPQNAGCFASSHGPYCGGEVFIWDVDVDCFDNLEFVDRYDYDLMKKQFVLLDLPQFGKYRYSFRGKSVVTGDGTGAVRFTEPIEVEGDLVVTDGGNVVSLIESGTSPFVGAGRFSVGKGGTHVAGIRSAFTAATPAVVVEAGGSFVVPSYSTTMVHSTASFILQNMSSLVVDGQLVSMPDGRQNALICAKIRGTGALVGETHC
jgi:hypothetical protein